ncbi:HU family DNA-binding protein [Streptomyces albidoflavus]|uniref:HU family DNA-binding protein n=1 Tax=Streptomyces TaxID=1883 RepID=UPI0004CB28A1|nr:MULTISPECIES: HU family DNA-binding protein [Streptomyces]MBL0780278.1 HU family DNA-binding protein [Streptomyces albidoflavus]MCG5119736.1 HU family DNA-binding protein [Streptomyces sp. T7(2022)]MCK2140724.1 HU family DNA-binding protein [Streptomyces sp. WAC00276]MCQ9705686.1 HU family DNA-binding protein [Streptomyces sp. BSP1]MCR0990524.1 HU family DNA-binding protein [Streptomyces albidoflavus]
MNKAQLVEAIADKVGGRQNAAEAVDAVLDAMVRAVVAGERVSVTGFGSFEKVDRPARYARNPQTGERVRVKKTSVPRFRAGQGFKDLVSGTKKLPKNDVAVKKAPKGSLTGGTKTTAKAAAKKATAKKASAAKKTTTAAAKKATPAKKTTAKKTSPAAKKTTATAKKATPAKSTAKKATAKKTAPAKKATATKAPAKKSSARKTTAKKTTATARKK